MPDLSTDMVEIFQNTKDPRNIFYIGGERWERFIGNMIASITGRETNSLPFALLNSDNSISISIHLCHEESCVDCVAGRAFDADFKTDYIVDQLDYHRQRLGFPLVSGKENLVESEGYVETTNMVTYRINLSPDHLDALLKLSNAYAYRGENGVLKLNRDIPIKEGSLCLFPVASLDEHTMSLRTAGCQTAEILSIQLLHMLSDFDGKVGPFHWDIRQVIDTLGIDRTLIELIMNSLLEQGKMTTRFIYLQSEGESLVQPPAANSAIKLVPLTPEARTIYLKYGNIGVDEIEHCLSAEIDIVDYLNVAKKHCAEMEKDYRECGSSEDVARQKLYIEGLDKMIERELNKRPTASEDKESLASDVPRPISRP